MRRLLLKTLVGFLVFKSLHSFMLFSPHFCLSITTKVANSNSLESSFGGLVAIKSLATPVPVLEQVLKNPAKLRRVLI